MRLDVGQTLQTSPALEDTAMKAKVWVVRWVEKRRQASDPMTVHSAISSSCHSW